ncbi:MAG: hypoxanthine phosphoribosyltransferase [Acidobacteria bacterium]|nr:hypoxanthine phosphoribosyltransferase [Acidobacteriota bacterium]
MGEVLFSQQVLDARVTQIGREITRDFSGRDLLVVAMLKGAVVFTCDLIRQIDLPVKLDFMSITKFRKHGRPTGIAILKDLDSDVQARNILIIEDIIDTGFSTNYLLRNLRARHPASLSICTLLDRKSIRIIDVPIDYRGFTIGEEYVIGYGLDYGEEYRDLPYIARLDVPSSRPSHE